MQTIWFSLNADDATHRVDADSISEAQSLWDRLNAFGCYMRSARP